MPAKELVPQKILIGSQWKTPSSGAIFKTSNPFTEEVICSVPSASEADVKEAIDAAKQAFHQSEWARSPRLRADILSQIAREFKNNAGYLATLEMMDTGRPIEKIKSVDIPLCLEIIDYCINASTRLSTKSFPAGHNKITTLMDMPAGVVGVITPWCFSLVNVVSNIIFAIAGGNTVVCKPSSMSPLSTLGFAKVCSKTDIPPGVINILTGEGRTAGEAIVKNHSLDALSFSGKPQTIKKVLAIGQEHIKKIKTFSGQKSTHIVFSDADIELVAHSILINATFGNGQVAYCPFYIFVQESIHEKIITKLADVFKKCVTGDPSDKDTMLGPLISRGYQEEALSYIENCQKEGARIVYGGKTNMQRGYFMMPAIINAISPHIKTIQKDVLAPIVVVISFAEFDKLLPQVRKFTASRPAIIWTNNSKTGFKIAQLLPTSEIAINMADIFTSHFPFSRLLPATFYENDPINTFTIPKTITMDLS